MKADYLNQLIDAYREVVHSMLQTEIQKGDVSKITEWTTTKEHMIYITYSGELTGFFAIGISDETARKMVQQVNPTDAEDEIMALKAEFLKELAEVTKNKSFSKLADLTYEVQVEEEIVTPDELPEFQGVGLKVISSSPIGEFDLHMQLNRTKSR